MGQALTDWVLSQVQPKGRFASMRQLALASGLSQSALNTILERGRAEPETLLKLAKSTGGRPVELFQLAGWLTEEEFAEVPSRPLSPQESELLEGFQDLPEEGRLWLLRSLRGMLRYQAEEGSA